MFHLYRVNPPLVRMVATVPLLWCDPKIDWANYRMDDFSREEVPMGIRFANANGARTFPLFAVARWACIPFSLLGALTCLRWATDVWGDRAGRVALALWCFDPLLLGHAPLVMPDVPAAATGVCAAYAFWKWLRDASWTRAAAAGVALGVACLCKTTLLLLVVLAPITYILSFRAGRDAGASLLRALREFAMLSFAMGIALYVVNLGYGCTGSLQRLDSFQFQSRMLGGDPSHKPRSIGNRWTGTWLASLPVPVPRDYLLGIDQQRTDFEMGDRCYLRGEWKQGGWWYFYLYASVVKTPLPTLALLAVAMFAWPAPRGAGHGSSEAMRHVAPCATWRDHLTLLLPPAAIFALASSQTNYTNHFRYVLPAFPFLVIWASRVAVLTLPRRTIAWAAMLCCLVWSIVSGLAAYPHGISYFNELAGGPLNGHRHLLDSNVAWGQDLLYLQRWVERHPEATGIGLATIGWVDPRLAGIESHVPPVAPSGADEATGAADADGLGPLPGWYVIDANFLHGTHWPTANGSGGWRETPAHGVGPNLEYFQRFVPIDRVGYSLFVYEVTRDQANQVRAELGLPPLPGDENRGDVP